MRNQTEKGVWLKWIMVNAVGELLGLGSTFAIGIGLFSGLADRPDPASVILSGALMTASGALEGFIVGFAQWTVLRGVFAEISRRAWVGATIVGAVFAWFFGSIPMILSSLSSDAGSGAATGPPQGVVLLMAAGMGLIAGLILSLIQFVVLRQHVEKAWQWLPINGIAWAAGMPLIFEGIDLAQGAGSVAGGIMIVGGTILIAGAVVGAIHGLVLVAFRRRVSG